MSLYVRIVKIFVFQLPVETIFFYFKFQFSGNLCSSMSSLQTGAVFAILV